jgi:hypothetical protein
MRRGAGWSGSRPAALASGRPFARRDHGPDGPDGPEGVEDLSLRVHAPSRASECGFPLSAAGAGSPVGTISAHGPDTGFGALPTMRGAPLGVTPGSIGFGSPTSPGQPAVVFPLATPARRSSRPSPRPSPRRGYRRGSRSALETGLRSRSEADVEREGIIVGVVSPCFSFSFAFFQQASL